MMIVPSFQIAGAAVILIAESIGHGNKTNAYCYPLSKVQALVQLMLGVVGCSSLLVPAADWDQIRV